MDWRKQRFVQELHQDGDPWKVDCKKQGDRENPLLFIQILQWEIRQKSFNVLKKAKKVELRILSKSHTRNRVNTSRKLFLLLLSLFNDLILLLILIN